MISFLSSDRSKPVAIWLFVVAALVLAMVVVGGATRLTDSGLSITEWKPIRGVVPPLNLAEWQAEFSAYKKIPQYAQLNAGMSLEKFQFIYWWEWSHRLLGRLLGLAFFAPFVVFAARRQLPRRLFLRLGGIFALGALQGLVGWWMVASGLADRLYVAPERLMVHLGLAFALFGMLLWTGFDAWSGAARQTLPSPWGRRAAVVMSMIYIQVLLGALVAGNKAGLVFNDWPLMNGHLFPDDYWTGSLWGSFAHSQGGAQLHHRLFAYLLAIVASLVGVAAWRSNYLARESKLLGVSVAAAVLFQACLGVATLMMRAPLGLDIAHQLTAALAFTLAVAFAWRVRRI